jgi:hypothetical protein
MARGNARACAVPGCVGRKLSNKRHMSPGSYTRIPGTSLVGPGHCRWRTREALDPLGGCLTTARVSRLVATSRGFFEVDRHTLQRTRNRGAGGAGDRFNAL